MAKLHISVNFKVSKTFRKRICSMMVFASFQFDCCWLCLYDLFFSWGIGVSIGSMSGAFAGTGQLRSSWNFSFQRFRWLSELSRCFLLYQPRVTLALLSWLLNFIWYHTALSCPSVFISFSHSFSTFPLSCRILFLTGGLQVSALSLCILRFLDISAVIRFVYRFALPKVSLNIVSDLPIIDPLIFFIFDKRWQNTNCTKELNRPRYML